MGTHTVGEFQTVNGNPQLSGLIANGFTSTALIPAGVTECATPGTPGFAGGYANCNFTTYRLRTNGTTGSYHSLQSQLKFQSWHGLTAVAAYTFSKNEDTTLTKSSPGTAPLRWPASRIRSALVPVSVG